MFVPARIKLRGSGGRGPPEGGWSVSEDVLDTAVAQLAGPGLVVLAGGPGAGRSTLLRRIGEAFRGQVFAGGGLAMLRGVPAFALARAVRVRLPGHDRALLAEAVRSRVRHGLLLLDDLQWADPVTIAALPAIAEHCRIAVTLRTPHRVPVAELRAVARAWLTVPALSTQEAAELARRVAPGLAPGRLAEVVRRAGGVPLAVEALARHAAAHPAAESLRFRAESAAPSTVEGTDPLAYAVATALADLTRPARTAIAALGLLGRPAPASLLGTGAGELVEAALVQVDGEVAAPACPYVAEVAAGLLGPEERRALHRRLAELVPAREAARHLAAAGDAAGAYEHAVRAAAQAATAGERAELLALACELPGVPAADDVRMAAAAASLAAGRPRTCLRALSTLDTAGAAVLRGEAHLQLGDSAAAAASVAAVPDSAPPPLRAARDRLRLLELLREDPPAALASAARIEAAAGTGTPPTGLRAALAAVRAATRTPGWEYALASAAEAAGTGDDALAARWSAWLLVETLAGDGRLAEAAQAASVAAAACALDLAYSWQTRFLAAQLWCQALRGEDADDVVTRAADLTDRTLPSLARGYASAAVSLVEADGGLLAPARARLRAAGRVPASAAALLDWVEREAAWLDGQPERALAADPGTGGPPLVDGLRRITARWAGYDAGQAVAGPAGTGEPAAVRETLEAWAAARGHPERFDKAAAAWHELARREEVRCLLAHGLHEDEPQRALPPLLAAERLAEQAGMVVLLGRARRALRRHAVRRDIRGPRSGDQLTEREREVLRLVARGEPTRRIAGQLGISRETVETHIRSGMRKLGARTRTEAAALALEVLG
jgi:DNA-binding CsgD family transcriptional regulator